MLHDLKEISLVEEDLVEAISTLSVYLLIIGGISLVSSFIAVVIYEYIGAQQSKLIQIAYSRALLNQEMEYFDKNRASEMTTRVSE